MDQKPAPKPGTPGYMKQSYHYTRDHSVPEIPETGYPRHSESFPPIDRNSSYPSEPPPSYSSFISNGTKDFDPDVDTQTRKTSRVPLFDPGVDTQKPKKSVGSSNKKVEQKQSKTEHKPECSKFLGKAGGFVVEKDVQGRNCCDEIWWFIYSVVVFGIGLYYYKEGNTPITSYDSTSYFLVGGGICLSCTVLQMCSKWCCAENKDDKACYILWIFNSLIVRLGYSIWGTVLIIQLAGSSKSDTQSGSGSTTTTSQPGSDSQNNGTDWLLIVVVAVAWILQFLYCCCRCGRRGHEAGTGRAMSRGIGPTGPTRNTNQVEADCCYLTLECLDGCFEIAEDCGRSGGSHTVCEGPCQDCGKECDNCCDCDCGDCDCGNCDCDCGNCDCGGC